MVRRFIAALILLSLTACALRPGQPTGTECPVDGRGLNPNSIAADKLDGSFELIRISEAGPIFQRVTHYKIILNAHPDPTGEFPKIADAVLTGKIQIHSEDV